MTRPIILYGPPAAGKDTITSAISARDDRYALFPLLKVGTGKTAGYRMAKYIDADSANIIVSWQRYGNTYAIDDDGLSEYLAYKSPIIHLGSFERVRALLDHTPATRWLVVDLICSRSEAEARLTRRNPADVAERLRIFDKTEPLPTFDLRIDTSGIAPEESADQILRHAAHL